MSARLRTVLLIDDSDADNFLHRRAIERSGLVDEIVVQPDGEAGLDFLGNRTATGEPLPELVLVDINMPRMTGWEFLDGYQEIDEGSRADTVLYIVSGTLNRADRARAESIDVVAGFCSKSLTTDALREIVRKHFPPEHPRGDELP